MKASNIIHSLSALIDSKIPSFIWGSSGIGKSSVIKKIASDGKIELIDLRLSQMNQIDFKEGSFLPKDGEGILLLDELDTVPDELFPFVSQLVKERQLGKYTLLEDWSIVAVGNPENKIPASLANSFVHLDMEVDINDWRDWAFSSGIDERIIAYVSYKNEDLLHADSNMTKKSFASPRSWENVHKILRSGIDETLLLDVIAGAIGKESAISFMSFSSAAYKLPDIEAILSRGEAEYPTEKDVLYTLSTVLVSFLLNYPDEQNLENVLKYLLELDAEFAVMIVQDLKRSGLSMESSEAFTIWLSKFSKLLN